MRYLETDQTITTDRGTATFGEPETLELDGSRSWQAYAGDILREGLETPRPALRGSSRRAVAGALRLWPYGLERPVFSVWEDEREILRCDPLESWPRLRKLVNKCNHCTSCHDLLKVEATPLEACTYWGEPVWHCSSQFLGEFDATLGGNSRLDLVVSGDSPEGLGCLQSLIPEEVNAADWESFGGGCYPAELGLADMLTPEAEAYLLRTFTEFLEVQC